MESKQKAANRCKNAANDQRLNKRYWLAPNGGLWQVGVVSDRTLENTLSIPASGIAFASGAALIGTAIAGPVGAVVGAVIGGVSGVITEVASQNARHKAEARMDSHQPSYRSAA